MTECPGCGAKVDRRNGNIKHKSFTCPVWSTARAEALARRDAARKEQEER